MNRQTALLRAFSVLLLLIAVVTAAGCVHQDQNESGSVSDDGVIPFSEDFSIVIGGESFHPEFKNCPAQEHAVVIYDCEYKVEGSPAVYVVLDEPGRTVIGFNPEYDGKELAYNVFALSDEAGFRCPVPYNGFVLTVPSDKIEGLRIRKGQLAKTEGSYQFPMRESLQGGSFYPSNDYSSALERRIDLMNPRLSFQNETEPDGTNRIYYYTSDYEGAFRKLPEECVVVSLERVTNKSSRITAITRGDHTENGEEALVFRGLYNMTYAEATLKAGDKLFLNKLDRVSSLSDVPAVYLSETLYKIQSDAVNAPETEKDGVYVFNNSFASLSVPKSASGQRDIVVIDDTVVSVGEKDRQAMIPVNGGIVLSFTGDMASQAEKVKVGDPAETVQLDTSGISGNRVRIGGKLFTFEKTDEIRAPEGVSVLYTPLYGETTGSNAYGMEIAVSSGIVTDVVAGKGNLAIPRDGFVLSIHKDAEQYDLALSVKAGDTAVTYRGGIGYGLDILQVSQINNVRSENTLILYRGRKSTETNAYGYEVAVGSDNRMTDQSYAGNMSIPDGGYVLSAHGTMVKLLEDAYCRGAVSIFDRLNMRVSVITTPETNLYDIEQTLLSFEQKTEEAKKQFRNLDYQSLDGLIGSMKQSVQEAKDGFRDADYDKAVSKLSSVSEQQENLTYELIETHPVENRAVWYRSNEKSDAEVESTVRKLKDLNVNAVYLETWYNGRFIGYSDNDLILHAAANGNYDALDGFVRICHESGIEVHAWVENFFIGTVEAQEQANTKLAEHFKGRWLKDQNGADTFFYSASNTHFIFMNPFEEEVQQFLLDFYGEILNKYDVDGIHLDYIRFPEKNGNATFGYNDNIVKAWQAENKTQVHPASLTSGQLMNSWNKFRQEIINGFVRRVFELVRKQKPSAWLSAAVYPDIPGIKNSIFQDCANWVENGYMDELFSMSYSGDTKYVYENASKFVSLSGNKCFYSTGLMAFGDSLETALGNQMSEVRRAGSDGVAIFSLANITPSHYYTPVKAGAFRSASTQANRLNETVSVQTEYLIDKMDTVFIPFGAIDPEDASAIRSMLESVKTDAQIFSADENDFKAKIRYCNQTVEALQKTVDYVSDALSGNARNAFRKDLTDLIHWLTVLSSRMEFRQ